MFYMIGFDWSAADKLKFVAIPSDFRFKMYYKFYKGEDDCNSNTNKRVK